MRENGRFVVDTLGATAPEFVTAALSRHPQVTALPGLAFVRDDLRLYRRHRLAGLSAGGVFERLWAPSFEPTGRMWAGIPRRFSPPARAALPLDAARREFAERWSPDLSYTETLFIFASCVAPAVGAAKAGCTRTGFTGAPFLRTMEWRELIELDVTVVSARTSLPIWLALASHRSVVNCLDALQNWIVHSLVVECARLEGVRIEVVDAVDVGRGNLEPAFSALRLANVAGLAPEPGPGHARFESGEFAFVESLAGNLAEMFAGDPRYEAAIAVDEWVPEVARVPRMRSLVLHYLHYWDESAHIHFDTVGPLEREIVASAFELGGQSARSETRSFERRLSQRFFHELIDFRSYSFEAPAITQDTYLGYLESLLVCPRAPYFAFAAVGYLERALTSQKKWSDSYISLRTSTLYRTLRSDAFRRLIEGQGLESRLRALEETDREVAEAAASRARGPAATSAPT